MKKYLLIILFISALSLNNYAKEELKFRTNVAYEIEYLASDTQNIVIKNVYWKNDWSLPLSEDESQTTNSGTTSSQSKGSRKNFKTFYEFLQIHDNGKEEIHIIDASRILRISLTLKTEKKDIVNPAPTDNPEITQKKPEENTAIDIKFE